jgi:hypothetical protein
MILTYLAAFGLIAGFVALILAFDVIPLSARVMAAGQEATRDLADTSMDDDTKEKVIQGHSLKMFGLFFRITLAAGAAILFPLGMIWSLDLMGLVSLKSVLDTTLSWPVLIGTTVLGVVVFLLRRKA